MAKPNRTVGQFSGDKADEPEDNSDQTRNDASLTTVLLVEDEAIVAMAEAAMLKRHGYAVTTVYDAESAISVVQTSSFDLVLMDIDLGDGKMDGTQAAEILLQEYDLPIVFLSSHTEPDIVARTESVSSYGYVVKGCGETVLNASLRMALRLYRAHREITEKNHQLRALFDNAEDLIGRLDRNRRHLYVNRALCNGAGIPFDQYIGKTPDELGFPPELSAIWNRAIDTVFETGEPTVVQFEFPGTQGTRTLECKIVPEKLKGDEVQTVVAVSRDITERHRIAQELRASEREKDVILNTTTEMVAYYDMDLRVKWANRAAADSVGKTPAELVGRHCYEIWAHRQTPCDNCPVLLAATTRQRQEAIQETPDGRYWYLRGYPIVDESGTVTGLVEFGQDITEQRKNEEALKEAVREKELLMRESQHRIKNNLLMVSSLIRLKESALEHDVDLSDLERQIDAVRIVHEGLHRSDGIGPIDVKTYVDDLLQNLFGNFATQPVRVENTLDGVTIGPKAAVTVGLIINELATNAIKYGFMPGEEAVFFVGCQKDESDNTCQLRVGNSGRPFPEDVDLDNATTLGMRLVTTLAAQLHGSVHLQKHPSPVFTFTFPLEMVNSGS